MGQLTAFIETLTSRSGSTIDVTTLITKLGGIQTGATDDQTGAEIKVAYEAEDDTNAYDDAAVTKLAGVGLTVLEYTVGDETTDLTAAADKFTFNMPFAMTLTDFRISAVGAPTGDTASTGTVTAATVLANDTVTVNGLLYTGVAGAKSDNTEFSVDTGNTETATDLADSITNDTRVGTDVAAIDQTAVGVAAVVTITAGALSAAGDAIGLSSSDGGTLAVSGANLAGGKDPLTVDLHEAGTTVLSTKATIDAGEKTSVTSAIPVVISDAALADDAVMSVDLDFIGGTNAGKGLKFKLIGTQL